MVKSIIAEGKTSNEAIKKGLKELGCKIEDVDIKVLENEDKKVFFSILDPRVVRVELKLKGTATKDVKSDYSKMTKTEDIEKCKESLKSFLDDFCKSYGDIEYELTEKDKVLLVNISGQWASKLIGYRGDTINAIQCILSAIGNKNTDTRVRIIVDVCNYKLQREDSLKTLARKLEKTVSRTGKKVVLEPMNAYERKVIHITLQDSKSVKTYSIGEEPRRKVVIEKL